MHAKRGVARAQSAMEYLTTYGWAILIIAVVLATLFSLGVFSTNAFAPRASPGSCQVYRPGGPASIGGIALTGACGNALPQFVIALSSISNSYVSVQSAPLLNLVNPYSISMWVYDTNTGLACGWLDKGYSAGGYMLWQEGGAGHMNLYVNNVGYLSGVPTPTQNVWHFFTVTVDSSGNAIWYTDNVQKASQGSVPSPTGNSVVLKIGSEVNNRGCMGQVANVQIYNTSLTANEIQAQYLSGIGGAPLVLQNLVGWWPLNQNAYDYSGNNNNGTATGVTYTSTWTSGYTAP